MAYSDTEPGSPSLTYTDIYWMNNPWTPTDDIVDNGDLSVTSPSSNESGYTDNYWENCPRSPSESKSDCDNLDSEVGDTNFSIKRRRKDPLPTSPAPTANESVPLPDNQIVLVIID